MPVDFNRIRHYRRDTTRCEKIGQHVLQRESHMQLQDFAEVVRSKNAGPRRFTLDIIFRSDWDYQRAAQSQALTAEKIAPLYGVPASAVQVINYPLGRAIKVVIPRRIMSGDPGDRDVYGAQQHTPLLGLEISGSEI